MSFQSSFRLPAVRRILTVRILSETNEMNEMNEMNETIIAMGVPR